MVSGESEVGIDAPELNLRTLGFGLRTDLLHLFSIQISKYHNHEKE